MDYVGWAIFMDCDILCRGDIAELWGLRNEAYALMCVQHHHVPRDEVKFLGEVQSNYERKNWSSLMLLNRQRCTKLTPEYVNTASGLELHRFHWLTDEGGIGALPMERWNHLVAVQDSVLAERAALLHWTLGCLCFNKQRRMGAGLSSEWFGARGEAMRLWN